MARLLALCAVVACSNAQTVGTPPPEPAPPAQPRHIVIRVVVDAPERATDNRLAIQQAIETYIGKRVVLELPAGAIYVDLGPHFDSIRFAGSQTTDLALVGQGADKTKLIIQGDAHSGLWLGIEIADGAQRISLSDFEIEQGVIENRSPTQQDHLIELNAHTATVSNIELSHIHFGACIGDGLRIAGTAPQFVEHVRAHDFVMRTQGQEQSREALSRSGVSLQRGFDDVEIYNFEISGARGSPIDMEPTGADVMNNLRIHDGFVDNSLGDTVYAVSLGGFEAPSHETTPLTNSSFKNIKIREGQLNILATSKLLVENVQIYCSGQGPMARASEPLLYVFHNNSDLTLRHVDITRDVGAGHGPLVLVTHAEATFPSNIEIDGGTWTSNVESAGKPPFLVSFESVQHLYMHDVTLRATASDLAETYGIKVRSSSRDVTDVRFTGLHFSSEKGPLKAAIWLAATNKHGIQGVEISNVEAPGVAETGVLFDVLDGSTLDPAPLFIANSFGPRPWAMAHGTRITPREHRAP